MSNLDVTFKIPLPRGGLILPLSTPQALSTEFRVHWRGGRAWSAWTGLRWSPGPMNFFFTTTTLRPVYFASGTSSTKNTLNSGQSTWTLHWHHPSTSQLLCSFISQFLTWLWVLASNLWRDPIYLMPKVLLTSSPAFHYTPTILV